GKILATLFFEPSTRTRLSFESAMLRLGGGVIGFSDMSASSAAKGESLEDTARVVSAYCDVMVVRHPIALSPHKMSAVATVPVINAGDGANEHPTQTLTDLVTIRQRFGRMENLKVGLCGDLKHGRTVHSLVKMLARYPGNQCTFIAPEILRMPGDIIDMLDREGISYTRTDNLEASIADLDVLYMTRVQKERFADPAEYEAVKGVYVLDREKLSGAKRDMVVMHPLPRVDEISTDVDDDERAWYFKQARFGVYARMALIVALLELDDLMGEDKLYVHGNTGRAAG
ncbi:MAG: aspartate carbamoyltransferase, partial [Clostridiales bacterium]|nr:aspartate carbamoyltransferase [Clostridiales bacterium]